MVLVLVGLVLVQAGGDPACANPESACAFDAFKQSLAEERAKLRAELAARSDGGIEVCSAPGDVAALRARAEVAKSARRLNHYGLLASAADKLEEERRACETKRAFDVRQRALADEETRKAAERAAREAERLQKQKAEEDERARVAQEKEDRIKAVLHNPTGPAIIVSTLICEEQAEERQALDEIKGEKENSKIAGVVDLKFLRDAQNRVVAARAFTKEYRKRSADYKLKLLPCSNAKVKALLACRPNTSGCGDTETDDLALAAPRLDLRLE